MKFLDLHYTYDVLRGEIDQAISRVLESGWYLKGEFTNAFEAEFAAYCDVEHAVAMSNGLDALYAILMASGVGSGDEVIVPAHTFIATWLAVGRTGATIVPVDADPLTMNWETSKVVEAISPRTRAIIPVHLYGQMVDMQPLRDLTKGTDILLIEDAAQAHGAERDGLVAGSAGHAAAFSFYPGKNLGAFGDAGAVTTSNAVMAKSIRTIGNYGSRKKYDHEVEGVNARMDEIQAAVLLTKLDKLAEWTERRRQIAQTYLSELADLEQVRLPGVEAGNAGHVWHLFVIRVPNRNDFVARLEQEGVPTLIHYPIPNHRSGAYQEQFSNVSFPVSEEICNTCVSLPIGPHLTDRDVGQVVDGVRKLARA